MSHEDWKPIPSTSGKYEINSQGQVRNARTGELRKWEFTDDGYCIVRVHVNKGKYRQISVHRSVMLAFKGDPPSPEHQVNHIDGAKTNNSLENLEWVTQKENIRDYINKGRRPKHHTVLHCQHISEGIQNSPTKKRGEDCNFAVLTEEQALMVIRKHRETGYGARKLSKLLSLPRGAIDHIIAGNSWKNLSRS